MCSGGTGAANTISRQQHPGSSLSHYCLVPLPRGWNILWALVALWMFLSSIVSQDSPFSIIPLGYFWRWRTCSPWGEAVFSVCLLLYTGWGAKGHFMSQMVTISFSPGSCGFDSKTHSELIKLLIGYLPLQLQITMSTLLFLSRHNFHVCYICALSFPYVSLAVFYLAIGSRAC